MSETEVKLVRKPRSEMDKQFFWKIEDMYANDDTWEKDFLKVEKATNSLPKFSGEFTKSAYSLHEFLCFLEEKICIVENVYVYANLRLFEDLSNSDYQALSSRARSLYTEFSAAISFFEPELLALDEKVIKKYFNEENQLEKFRHQIEFILLKKTHILSSEQENILASVAEIGEIPSLAFDMFANTDLNLGTITNETGETVKMTMGLYVSLLNSENREIRKNAFNAVHKSYANFQNTLAENYYGCVKKDMFFAKTRKYESSLQSFVAKDNIPENVYKNLLDAIHDSHPALQRYIGLRKKILKVDKLYGYDLLVPIVSGVSEKISYAAAQETIIKALAPLGKEYEGLLKQAFSSQWIDVYENECKRDGAFQWGSYGTHPFVMMNFNDEFDDMMTLAHELGHAMHSHYTYANQPFIYAETPIFLAEIASTVNETLLIKYLINDTTDKKRKAYLLNHLLDSFRQTVYRQALFAEFELLAHEAAEAKTPLTSKMLNSLYKELLEKYYGNDFECTEENESEWSRIPHFYSPFYMYQYATGFSAAMAFSKMILNNSDSAVEKYIGFLKSGSSEYPIETLQKAGLDMSTPEVIKQGLSIFAETVAELEELLL